MNAYIYSVSAQMLHSNKKPFTICKLIFTIYSLCIISFLANNPFFSYKSLS